MEPGTGQHSPLAGAQRGGYQHRHAAVKYRCCKLTEVQLYAFLLLCSFANVLSNVLGE